MPAYTDYRRTAAQIVHPYYLRTAGAGSDTTTIVDGRWPIKTSSDAGDLFTDQFILRPDATNPDDRCRSIHQYLPAPGAFLVDNPWSVAPAKDEAYEIHGIIEPEPTMLRLINEGLKRTLVVVEFTIPAVIQQQRHKVNTTQPWLTEPKWVRQVGWLTNTERQWRERVDPYTRAVPHDTMKLGSDMYIVHNGSSFDSNTTLYIKALKPAYFHCRATGGVWGDQNGLSVETDEAIPQEDWVAAATRLLAWEQFNLLMAPSDKDLAEKEQQKAASIFSDLTEKYLDVPAYTGLPTEVWGPHQGGIY